MNLKLNTFEHSHIILYFKEKPESSYFFSIINSGYSPYFYNIMESTSVAKESCASGFKSHICNVNCEGFHVS